MSCCTLSWAAKTAKDAKQLKLDPRPLHTFAPAPMTARVARRHRPRDGQKHRAAQARHPHLSHLCLHTAGRWCRTSSSASRRSRAPSSSSSTPTPFTPVPPYRWQVVSHVIIGLKTVKGTKQLKLDPTIYDALTKEKVSVGDVIYIEANSGAVKRVGRCDAYATEFDLEAEEYVPMPKGDVHKRKEIVQDVTLHDLDSANARPQ
eukprot:133818-Chlamydomonas_euryale.AAC.1